MTTTTTNSEANMKSVLQVIYDKYRNETPDELSIIGHTISLSAIALANEKFTGMLIALTGMFNSVYLMERQKGTGHNEARNAGVNMLGEQMRKIVELVAKQGE